MQLVQAANASRPPDEYDGPGARRFSLIGWRPHQAGWLSSFTQFVGTRAFNADTFDAILNRSRWYVEDARIWLPDMVGSILFLVSGYLAFIEAGRRYSTWRPKELSWRIVFINLLGWVAFMIAALLSYYPNGAQAAWIVTLSTVNTSIGAFCFSSAPCSPAAKAEARGRPLPFRNKNFHRAAG